MSAMFTQRHYIAVAEAFVKARKLAPKTPDGEAGVGAVLAELMELFKKDNPLFHEFRFFEACTREPGNGHEE